LVPHDLSIVDYLIGRTPERVVATGACHTAGGQVDVAYINLDYGRGLIANVHVNWLSPVKVRRMILGGDRRMVIFDDLASNEKVRVYDSTAIRANSTSALSRRTRFWSKSQAAACATPTSATTTMACAPITRYPWRSVTKSPAASLPPVPAPSPGWEKP
jgi:predicted dehydrogenase